MPNLLSNKTLAVSFGIQVFGVVATFGTSIFVARTLGASGQGHWATIRSVVDLVAVIMCFGLPTAIPYFVNVKRIAGAALIRAGILWLIFCFPVGLLLLITAKGMALLSPEFLTNHAVWLLATASTLLAAHGLWRALCLASSSTAIFNTATVAYPLSQLAVLVIMQPEDLLRLLYCAAIGPLAAIVISVILWIGFRHEEKPDVLYKIPIKAMASFGISNVAVSGLTAAQPAIAIASLSHVGASDSVIGLLSVALLAMGAMLMPANILGPVIYNAWTRNIGHDEIVSQYRRLFRASFLVATFSVIVVIPITPLILEKIFGHEFYAAAEPTQILLLAVPLGYGFRLMVNALMSNGNMLPYSLVTLIRLISMVILIQIPTELDVISVAWAWLTGELIAFVSMAMLIRKTYGWRIRDVLGF